MPTGLGCDGCTLCCTVMKVSFAPEIRPPKREHARCEYACGRGCMIYDKRPHSCRVFECAWLASQRWPDRAMPKHERPDRSGMVLEVNSKGTVIAHLRTPEAWRDEKNLKRLMFFNRTAKAVTIEHGDGRVSCLEKDGTVTELTYLDTADNGERRYVRPEHPLVQRLTKVNDGNA